MMKNNMDTPFQIYLDLLLKLHAAKGNEELEDQIRDQMDEPYYKLNTNEAQIIDEIIECIWP